MKILNLPRHTYFKKPVIKQALRLFSRNKFIRIMNRINTVGETLGARVCFLDMQPAHYQFSKAMIHDISKKLPVVLLVTDKRHPAYKHMGGGKNIYVFYLNPKWLPFALRWLRIPFLVTPASHLHPSTIHSKLSVIHSYHSLVSMHFVYGDDAFDAYTHFFACGPHHVSEIEAIKKARGLPPATVFSVGYPKLDELAKLSSEKVKKNDTQKTILLAPSWHSENLLKLHCIPLCEQILKLGFNLIVRPHPLLYTQDSATMTLLRSLTIGCDGRLLIEDPNTEFASFWTADLMISDWSGVAFEYAFATERPVVFIDGHRKSNSIELLKINLTTMEDVLRSRIGVVVHDIDQLGEGINQAFSDSPEQWQQRIREVRKGYIFNFMSSVEVGSTVLANLANHAQLLEPHTDSPSIDWF